nr:GrpB family protein [Clostridium sp. Marseille-P299]
MGVPKYKVLLVEHDEQWAEGFEKTKLTLANIHGENVVDIQHVGSTAIKGIMAKPMLDIAIVFKALSDSVFIIMKDNGYEYFGEVVTGKHLFILRGEGEVSLQHIHCYEEKKLEHFLTK